MKRILSWLMVLCLVVGMVPLTASAEEVEIEDFSGLKTAFENGGDIVLGNDVTADESLTLANDKNLTIDLNGRTIDMGNKSATISGTLTIRDSSAEQNGEITSSSSGQLAKIQNGGTMVLASGNITGKEYIQVRTGGNFNMTGGKIEASGSYALYVYGGTATITGGTVTGEAVYVYSGNFIMGSNSQKQTSAEAQKIYVETLNPKNNDVALYSGIVGKVQSSFGANSTLDCWFESDVSNRVPDGKMCESFTESEKTYYRVVNLTDDKAEAKIGDTLYASAITAATAMQEGETLVLLKNITGDSGDALLKISVPNVTIDLNGFSITNTNENGTGISVEVPYKYNGSTTKGNAVIKNSGGAATVSAATPLRFNVSDGISLQSMKVELSGPITLKPAQAVDSRVSLGNNVYLVYSEEAASMIANGGFKATNEEGSFIYGTASDAIRADKDHTAVLLNDYLGSSSITLASGDTGIVDLNGKTYTVTSGNGINVNDDNTNLTVKNGTVISENGDGAQVGIPAAGQSTSGTSLTLDNVTLTVKGREYGIVSNGTCTGINLTLRNNTVLNASEPVTLVPTGPLSNIAMAIRREPKILEHIDEIVLMGGAYQHGNVTPAAEFNIYADAEAAHVVFSCGRPVVMMGLDLTRQALCYPEIVERMNKIETKGAKLFVDLMRFFCMTQKKVFGWEGGPLHDPTTIAYLIDPDCIETKAMHTDIDISGGQSHGRTNCDYFNLTDKVKNTKVAVKLHVDRFWDIVEENLKLYDHL